MTEPPPADVVEVSIFGPGKGECVAVHVGYGDWIIVDSCVDQITKTVPVLDYLGRIGVNPATDVRIVLASHAHDDHVSGISRVFQACSSASFVCSSAITQEEFFALIELEANLPSVRARIREEYRKVFEIVESRGRSENGLKSIMNAIEGRTLLNLNGPDGITATVRSLSPSDEARPSLPLPTLTTHGPPEPGPSRI